MVSNGKNGNGKHGTGYPAVLDWDLIASLCEIQCTMEEIAFICKCSKQTLRNHAVRNQGSTFEDYLEEHRCGGKVSLRRAQFSKALGSEGKPFRDEDGKVLIDQKGKVQWEIDPVPPDTAMQIWLGKQHLGQKEPPHEIGGIGDKPITLKIVEDA